jgi:hypothetical protein
MASQMRSASQHLSASSGASIDLAHAYRAVDALMAEHGRTDPYAVEVRAWNHRHTWSSESKPVIEVAILIVPETPELCLSSKPCATFAIALAAIREQLAARFPVEPLTVPLPSVCTACDHAEHGAACEVETGGVVDDRDPTGRVRTIFRCGCTGKGAPPRDPDDELAGATAFVEIAHAVSDVVRTSYDAERRGAA